MRKKAKDEAIALAELGFKVSDRKVKHGINAWINQRRLPGGRRFREIRRQMGVLKRQMIKDYGGEQIRPEALILIDGIFDDLGIRMLTALYIRRVGPVSQKSIKEGALALHPLLGSNWLGYGNAITRSLLALKEFMPHAKSQVELEAYLTSFSRVDEAKQAEEAPQVAQDGRTSGDARDRVDGEDKTPVGEIQDKEVKV